MRAPATEATGTSGASMAKANFERLGWGAVENTTHDVGTDLFLMARDERRFDLGVLVGAQVKSGPSFFESKARDDSGAEIGWWFSSDQGHFDAWLDHTVPHLIILQDLDSNQSYWTHITREAVQSTGKGAKILVPRKQVVDDNHREDLLAVATSQRPAAVWEGSAWTGAQDLSSSDLLRYAMVVPRLVAPHPNFRVQTLTPEQYLAMVVLVRVDELSSRRHLVAESVPSVDEAAKSADWRWRFSSALYRYLTDDRDPKPLADCIDLDGEPACFAAGSIAASAALIECGQIEDAIKILDTAIDADRCWPVDQAWLLAQRARALAELGKRSRARNDALAVQTIRAEYPHDASATAIAGAAARLVFQVSDIGSEDISEVVTVADSAGAWWWTQVLAQGLGQEADQHFAAWAGGEPSDSGANQLRAASLIAGFTADHGSWRRAMALFGRHRLMPAKSSCDADEVVGPLVVLRLAGDRRSLSDAASNVMRSGPAQAVSRVASEIDLDVTTHTRALTEIEFLTAVGDVVATPDADRHMDWALQVLEDQRPLAERIDPGFDVHHYLLKMINGLLLAVGQATRRRVIDRVLSLDSQAKQSAASGWARIVRSMPSESWTPDDADRARARSGEHNWELEYALLGVAAPRHEEVMQRLITEAEAHQFKVLHALRELKGLPDGLAKALREMASRHVCAQLHRADSGGGYAMGADWAWYVAALNLSNPSLADWPTLLQLIQHPLAHPQHVIGAVNLLASNAHEVPREIALKLSEACRSILDRRPVDVFSSTDIKAEAKWAAISLEGVSGTRDPACIFELLAGSETDRRIASLTIGLDRMADQLPALTALAFDESPVVHGAASEALGIWVGDGVGGDRAIAVARRVIQSSGTRRARRFVSGFHHVSQNDLPGELSDVLTRHVSAWVRHELRPGVSV